MLEVMQFIFSSFWIWFGTVILISAPFYSIKKLFNLRFKYKKRDKIEE